MQISTFILNKRRQNEYCLYGCCYVQVHAAQHIIPIPFYVNDHLNVFNIHSVWFNLQSALNGILIVEYQE